MSHSIPGRPAYLDAVVATISEPHASTLRAFASSDIVNHTLDAVCGFVSDSPPPLDQEHEEGERWRAGQDVFRTWNSKRARHSGTTPCGAFLENVSRSLPALYRRQLELLLHGTFAGPGIDIVLCFVAGGPDPFLNKSTARDDNEWDARQRAYINARARMGYCRPLSAPFTPELDTTRAKNPFNTIWAPQRSVPSLIPEMRGEIEALMPPPKVEPLLQPSYTGRPRSESNPHKRPMHVVDVDADPMDSKRPRYSVPSRFGFGPMPFSPPPSTVSRQPSPEPHWTPLPHAVRALPPMRRTPSPLPFRVVGPAPESGPSDRHARWRSDSTSSAPNYAALVPSPSKPSSRSAYPLSGASFADVGSDEDASGEEDDELDSAMNHTREATATSSPQQHYRRTYTHRPAGMQPPAPPDEDAEERYMREAFQLGPDMQLTLDDLQEPPRGERPTFALPILAALAIHGSPQKKLTLSEIFQAIEDRFEWYARNRNVRGWKNSIRHNLSLNKIFRQVPRPITEGGKGQYWRLDFSDGVGNKRERKRRTKKGDATQSWPTPLSSPGAHPTSPRAHGATQPESAGARHVVPSYPPASDARLALLSAMQPASPPREHPPAADARQALISAVRRMPVSPPPTVFTEDAEGSTDSSQADGRGRDDE